MGTKWKIPSGQDGHILPARSPRLATQKTEFASSQPCNDKLF